MNTSARTTLRKKISYVIQEEMRGQSDALYLAREYLQGPMLMAFSDTLIETDLDPSSITRKWMG